MSKKIEGGFTVWARKSIYSELFYKPDKWFKIWFYIVNAVSHKTNEKKGYIRGQRNFTYEMISLATNSSFSQIKHCIEFLKKGKHISTKKKPRSFNITVNKYDFYQNFENYKNDEKGKQKDQQVDEQEDQQEDQQVGAPYNKALRKHYKSIKDKSIPIAVKEILTYLNEKTGKNFRETTTGTVSLIKALLKKGRTVEDFKKVIDNKLADKYFQDNPKYMRPETLFNATKFEGYLNEKPVEDHGEPGIAGEAYGGIDHEV